MSAYDSPISFREQQLSFDDIPKELLDPDNCELGDSKTFSVVDQALLRRVESAKSTLQSLKDRLKSETDKRYQKEEEINELRRKTFAISQSLEELSLKKNVMQTESSASITKDELSEMAQKVVLLEKEQELRQNEMKKTAQCSIGQMCFYKEYLNIYIDIKSIHEHDYILYFRKCRAEDKNKPPEWIWIKTDDFKKFTVVDIGSRGNVNDELLKQIKYSDKKLRELIIEVRELCLNKL